MSDKLIGDIKYYLQREKISQEDFAHKIGVSFSTLNRWLNKKTKPKSKAIIEAVKRAIG
ncbi:MAG: helix-turn-helix transcriptional regulator [Candidatus Omnitrophica bacterium]|nr:helix-turn-helix transcriptional regulator [Candidatus Omnitrophota bacterium]MBU4488256.1 helix-turn-helix transcriptional regulator [Candidatus Omnitrophota bacterium]MCG2704704.1 helix-turn-helix transcriptional regulator [Candidatus Omnitrophota bacterium]